MSTIASPRPSLNLSSRRTSIDTTTSNNSRQQSSAAGPLRRNRTALRDYYNLPSTSTPPNNTASPGPATPDLDHQFESVLDALDFDAQAYVAQLLATSGLEGVLRVEAGLVSEIRTLDGEKKALVYDNYSKLIKATETIRNMREKMDDGEEEGSGNGTTMVMMTRTLGPAVEKIGDMANDLVEERKKEDGTRLKQQAVVRWVLGASERIEGLVESGKKDEAKGEWERVDAVLEKWEGVEGVEGVKRACLKALEGG